MKNIATSIKRARKRAKLTQAEAARRAGISRQHMSALEGGTYEHPRLTTLDAIAKALGCRLVVELKERGA